MYKVLCSTWLELFYINMIKLIIFDLDGVLYDSKKFHFDALNKALERIDKKYVITYKDHIATFDGLPTIKKLEILGETRGLNESSFDDIWKSKQSYTNDLLGGIKENAFLIENLRKKGII